ncbi:MAG: replication-associated recombination protein A [Chloroflexota bacterium]
MARSQASPFQPSLLGDQGDASQPLAARVRPRSLGDMVGHERVLGPGHPLRRAIESGRTGSLVLWGPPGSGKTTLAQLIASATNAEVRTVSAVTEGVADLRQIITQARQIRDTGGRSVLIVDEIHRWSRSQQAALLPHVEEGLVTLIGVTSENPYFDIIAPLRSRLRLFRLEPLTDDDLRAILRRAVLDAEHGLGHFGVTLTAGALDVLVAAAAGDARTALNALEAAALAVADRVEKVIHEPDVRDALQARNLRYDKQADDHYQTISAYIKSVRGSDPDAAVFWLAKMLMAGEEIRFITRRMVILASEDIGNADPQALVLAMAAAQAAELIGYPEVEYTLAQATLYLALAPKSNSAASAIHAARSAIEHGAGTEVPLHLRNASFQGAEGLGFGRDYKYPHDFPRHWAAQQYFPDGVSLELYSPSSEGLEPELTRALRERRGGNAERLNPEVSGQIDEK